MTTLRRAEMSAPVPPPQGYRWSWKAAGESNYNEVVGELALKGPVGFSAPVYREKDIRRVSIEIIGSLNAHSAEVEAAAAVRLRVAMANGSSTTSPNLPHCTRCEERIT